MNGNGLVFVVNAIVCVSPPAPNAALVGLLTDAVELDDSVAGEGPNDETTQASALCQALELLRTAATWAEHGRISEALPLIATATCIYRRLALMDPETYLPDLARALTELATMRSYESWESAVPPAQEATHIYRRLAGTRVDAVPDLAGSLSNLLTLLWEMAAVSRSRSAPPPIAATLPRSTGSRGVG